MHDLLRVNYAEALALQRRLRRQVIDQRADAVGPGPMHLLLLEHDPPVITISRRPGARRNLMATDEQLGRAGVEIAETDRGGDITYHGPGQLVAYAILDLNRLGLRINSYLRLLEQVVIDALASFGVHGERDSAATGVWVNGAKVAAIGVRVSRWVTMHGLALNVTTNLAHFDLIVPCGLAGRGVTSLQRELRRRCPTMGEVKAALAQQFSQSLNLRLGVADCA